MNSRARNVFLACTALAVLVGASIAFPRVLAFVELAAREIRVLWWLILMVSLGVWLAFFYGRKRE